MKPQLPWWSKLLAKLLLARLPVSYSQWRKLKLFKHGEMNDPSRALRTFEKYYAQACRYTKLEDGFTVLELGPGDSILSGLVASGMGASKAWLVDAGAFADTNIDSCHQTAELLKDSGYTDLCLHNATNLQEVLKWANVTYLTHGTSSLKEIPDASVDFIWSQVVLEHVLHDEFPEFMGELRRIMKPRGVGVHSVDFRDHLGSALNNLRFPKWIWESKWFRGSGFYTNRIRPSAMLNLITGAGFEFDVTAKTYWSELPTPRRVMNEIFQNLPEDDLMLAEYEVIFWPS